MQQAQFDKVKANCLDQYPQFFDDETNQNKLDDLIMEADLNNNKYAKQLKNDDRYRLLVQKYVLAELFEVDNSDGDLSSFKADIFQLNMNPNNQTNVFWAQYQRLLAALGLNKWKIKLL